MREIWVKISPWNKDLFLAALEKGADGLWIEEKGLASLARELARIPVLAPDGDFIFGENAVFFTMKDGSDEEELARLASEKLVILETPDWTIIPLENLIARKIDVMPLARSLEEAETAFGILEVGVGRVMLDMENSDSLLEAIGILKKNSGSLSLETAKITEIRTLGMGDRVCVDTCTNLFPGQGMLVGNSSSAFFLIHAETKTNPYVAPRPFRINAGAVHAYTFAEGDRTKYLSELNAGDTVRIVNASGDIEVAVVGRVKIEKRPLLLVQAMIHGRIIHTIVQNAETICLTSPEGKALSVTELQVGDQVLVHLQKGGRHFGHAVDESIVEL